MTIRIRYWISYVIILAFLGTFLFAAWLYFQIRAPYKNYSDGKFMIVERKMSSRWVAQRLVEEGVISNKWTFLIYLAVRKKQGETLKAGEYYFDAPASQLEVIDKLVKGRVFRHLATIPEGSNIYEVATILAETGIFKKDDLLVEMHSTRLIKDIDDMADDLEGYLFPDTYLFTRDTSSAEIIKRILKRFREVFDEQAKKRAGELKLSIKEVVTLASLIEKETGKDNERPLVAAVFLNRLRRDMPLQCDPTALYAVIRQGKPVSSINKEILNVESPYNTYRHLGLPPGPIANPGRKAIEAALNPGKVDFLYFVSKNDGTHFFSKTLAQHNDAVNQYQRQSQ